MKNSLAFDRHRIDDTNDDGINRKVLRFRGQTRTTSLRDQDHVAITSAKCVDGDKGPPCRHQFVAGLTIKTIRLDDQQFMASHRRNFLRAND